MKIIVIGGSGTIGRAVVAELSKRHQVITVGFKNGDYTADIRDINSLHQLYTRIGNFDAVISTAGKVHFGSFTEMTDAQLAIGLQDKLMGQVNMVRAALNYINANGSFTLTSGILSHDPIRFGVSASLVNGAIDSFIKAAAIELPRGLRINSINPSVVTEAMEAYGEYFYGYQSVPTARVALAYSKSVEGLQTGQTYYVW